MNSSIDPLEILWDDLLSRQPDKIRTAFDRLDASSQAAVLEHLQRMTKEPDWHPEQRTSAFKALQTLSTG